MGWQTAAFGSAGHVTWGEESARAILVFVFGLLAVRVAGRRVFGKWAALDIVVSVIVGSNLSRAITGGAPLFSTLTATAAILAMHWLFAQAAARWRWVSRIVEGKPVTLAVGTGADRGKRLRWSVSDADVQEALRAAGLEDAASARALILEPSGKLTVVKGEPDRHIHPPQR